MITGAAGFLGAHLSRRCLALEHDLHGVVRPTSDISRLDGSVPLHRFDIRDENALRSFLDEVSPEVVFHLAATPRRSSRADLTDMREFVREDLDSLVLLLRLCSETRRPPKALIRTGSLAEYGTSTAPCRETQREAPVTAYGAHLVAGTHLATALQPRLPFPVTTARLALVFGPGQSEEYLVPQLISRCLARQEVVVLHPNDRRDLIFVEDAVAGLLRLAEVPSSRGRIVNLCSGSAPSMRAVAKQAIAATGADPRLVVFRHNPCQTGPSLVRGSPALAWNLLGWRARIPVSEGLKRMVSERVSTFASLRTSTSAHLAGV